MPFREDILKPISEEKPSGPDLRYDPAFDKIKEARREEDDIDQGDWKRERKIADWQLTSKLSEEFLAAKSKDLQVAVWLVEAATKLRGLAGMIEGFAMLDGLVQGFWETLWPEIEDGDAEFRAAPLEWLAQASIQLLRTQPMTKDGYDHLKFKESRDVGYEEGSSGNEAAAKARKTKLDEGKLSAEAFDDSFSSTPKAFYVELEAKLRTLDEGVRAFGKMCDEKFGDASPSFTKFFQTMEEVRQTAKSLLEKKREVEPDPINEETGEPVPETSPGDEGAEKPTTGPTLNIGAFTGNEPVSRRAAIESAVQAAYQLRQADPTNPGAYLMMRGLRFGELRAAAARGDMRQLEAPPTETRRQLREHLLATRWKELLELTEASLALPASRAWMDLHRMTCEALIGLGDDYNTVVGGIRGEVRALVRDVPEIRGAVLMDDTPACNPQTLQWLDDIADDPAAVAEDSDGEGSALSPAVAAKPSSLPWRKRMADPFRVAVEALRRGDKPKALEIMRNEVESQASLRGKFLRKLQVAELCIQANQKEIAQPFLTEILDLMSEYKVQEWEDRSVVVQALADVYLYHEDTIDSSSDRRKVYERICKLDPVRALSLRT
jgi:type VI secretion system protein ImpA